MPVLSAVGKVKTPDDVRVAMAEKLEAFARLAREGKVGSFVILVTDNEGNCNFEHEGRREDASLWVGRMEVIKHQWVAHVLNSGWTETGGN